MVDGLKRGDKVTCDFLRGEWEVWSNAEHITLFSEAAITLTRGMLAAGSDRVIVPLRTVTLVEAKGGWPKDLKVGDWVTVTFIDSTTAWEVHGFTAHHTDPARERVDLIRGTRDDDGELVHLSVQTRYLRRKTAPFTVENIAPEPPRGSVGFIGEVKRQRTVRGWVHVTLQDELKDPDGRFVVPWEDIYQDYTPAVPLRVVEEAVDTIPIDYAKSEGPGFASGVRVAHMAAIAHVKLKTREWLS